jgi:hypothetical protein
MSLPAAGTPSPRERSVPRSFRPPTPYGLSHFAAAGLTQPRATHRAGGPGPARTPAPPAALPAPPPASPAPRPHRRFRIRGRVDEVAPGAHRTPPTRSSSAAVRNRHRPSQRRLRDQNATRPVLLNKTEDSATSGMSGRLRRNARVPALPYGHVCEGGRRGHDEAHVHFGSSAIVADLDLSAAKASAPGRRQTVRSRLGSRDSSRLCFCLGVPGSQVPVEQWEYLQVFRAPC